MNLETIGIFPLNKMKTQIYKQEKAIYARYKLILIKKDTQSSLPHVTDPKASNKLLEMMINLFKDYLFVVFELYIIFSTL